jgi:prevent-host-death family protein
MRTITAMDLRRRLGEVLDRASAGERIVVERDRRPMAVLVPYEDAVRLEEDPDGRRTRALAALDRLEAFAQRMTDDAAGTTSDAATVIREERAGAHQPDR